LLEKIFFERGWDFRNYKRSSMKRRILKRLGAVGVSSFSDYRDLLDRDPSEYTRLFSNLTVKVSEFFRDPSVFEFLDKEVRRNFSPAEGIRAWCCGCACGEEAYSLAMLLSEFSSADALRRTKIFATDIDNDAVDAARMGRYREESVANVSAERMDRYFFKDDGCYKVKYNVRNLVKFGSLDIVRSPSISKVNILFCRNVFIYFNKTLQEKVFEKLDYAVKPGGLLVLGKAEVVPSSFSCGYVKAGKGMNVYRKVV
ncbi:MAG: protein-glutamate O-methyltransferase CheR, partial [Deltaproteobacteria bacterium]